MNHDHYSINVNTLLEFHEFKSFVEAYLTPGCSLRIYHDPILQQFKTDQLQKGLVINWKGVDLVGEGMGFGVPVVKYSDDVYFSKNADFSLPGEASQLKKTFRIDGVERIRMGRMGKVQIPNPLWRLFAYVYRSSLSFNRLIIRMDQAARKRVNAGSKFITVNDRGSISVTYEMYPGKVHVHFDLTSLNKEKCHRIFILNEQGSRFFRRYTDSHGNDLKNEEIMAWGKVKAEKASFSDMDSSLGFSLRNRNNSIMWSGRETHLDLAWAGLIYEISPRLETFDYDIFIEI
jgi:hypothetical protein